MLGKVYKTTSQYLKGHPVIFIPFTLFALVELIVLTVLYLAPRAPLKAILGPPIRTFWGEAFLHYPTNFLLLAKLDSLARMCLSVVIGSLLTGVAAALILGVYNKKHPKLGTAFKTSLKKYFSLALVVLLITVLFYALTKGIFIGLAKYFMAGHAKLLWLGPRLWLGPIILIINFILAVLIQSVFTYCIPAIIIDNVKFLKSVL